MLSSGADESAHKVSPEMTTEEEENPFKMAEEGVAEVNRLVPSIVDAVEMSRLKPSRSHTILGLLLAVRSNGLEQVVDVLVPQFKEVVLGVSARTAIWSAQCQIIDMHTTGVPGPHAVGEQVVPAAEHQRMMASTSSVCHAGVSHCVEHARPGSHRAVWSVVHPSGFQVRASTVFSTCPSKLAFSSRHGRYPRGRNAPGRQRHILRW